jgi:DNA polymerase delta subunit 4
MTRLERYDRAAGLGLDPPKKVLEVIQRRGVDDARWRESLWFSML